MLGWERSSLLRFVGNVHKHVQFRHVGPCCAMVLDCIQNFFVRYTKIAFGNNCTQKCVDDGPWHIIWLKTVVRVPFRWQIFCAIVEQARPKRLFLEVAWGKFQTAFYHVVGVVEALCVGNVGA